MTEFVEGDRVRFNPDDKRFYSAKRGATATVTGQGLFPSHVSVRWDRGNPLSGSQIDGGYLAECFELIAEDFNVGDRVRSIKASWDAVPIGSVGTIIPCPNHPGVLSVAFDHDPTGDGAGGWAMSPRQLERIAESDSESVNGDGKPVTFRDGWQALDGESTDVEPMSRGEALANGDRMNEYGHPKVSFGRIASLWSAYLSAPEVDPEDLTGRDVAALMILLKVSRSITDGKADTLDDIEGYVACARMLDE